METAPLQQFETDDELNARLLAALPERSAITLRERVVDYEIVEQAVLLRTRELTSVQITAAYLNRIGQFNGPFEIYDNNLYYNAFVRIDVAEAMAQAALADQWLADPERIAPPLCGIAFGAKDVIAIKGRECKNGTHAFDTNLALEDATIVARLRAQGAVLLGHTICSEFSGSTDGDFGANAWDPKRVPGGSSSGSGIAPVARLCAAALAEETGGSLIIPAAANGASAIKPSLGLASTAGLMPLSMGWDVPGVIGRSVRDSSLVMAIIGGPDPLNDPLTLSAPIPMAHLPIKARISDAPLTGVTIGIPQTDWMYTPGETGQKPPSQSYDADYRLAFERFRLQLISLGANVREFPGLDMSNEENRPYVRSPYFYEIIPGEFPLWMSPFSLSIYPGHYEANYWQAAADFALTRPDEYKEQLLNRYNVDFFHPQVDLLPYSVIVDAQERRRQQQALWQQALDEYDIDFMLVMPLGSHIGLRHDIETDRDPATKGLQVRRDLYELPNGLGWPMVTFPIGYGSTGVESELPVNAAFWGRRFSEVEIIQAAIDYQHHYPEYHNAAPPDPDFPGPPRPPTVPRVQPLDPRSSTDPAVIERG